MFKATKGDRTMTLLDGVQVAAFEKSGWVITLAAGETPAQAAPPTQTDEPVAGEAPVQAAPAEEPAAGETPAKTEEPVPGGPVHSPVRQEADALGISYHPNIGDEKLQAKIDAVKAEKEAD